MQFTAKEMTAVIKAAKLMALADGVVVEKERELIEVELKSFGIVLNSLESVAFELAADNMEGAETISVLSSLSLNQKKYVCGYLAAIMSVDGDIDDNEKKLWSLISLLANFPTMTIRDSIAFWAKEH